jgi:hypothetical protein
LVVDDNKEGTLGGFVDLPNGDIGILTCAHVLFDLSSHCDASAQFDVVQPSYGYMNNNIVCGTHERSCFPRNELNANNNYTIDAALVKLTERVPERGLFADLTVQNLNENGEKNLLLSLMCIYSVMQSRNSKSDV